MKTIFKLSLLSCLAAGLTFGATFSGNLVDAGCAQKDATKAQSCQPTATTNSFALLTSDGKVYTLDTDTNQEAMQLAKSDMAKLHGVTVTGDLSGTAIDVESVKWGGAAAAK